MTPTSRVVSAGPTLDAERAFWFAGYRLVAGVDEVGRGALAGPLVAAAVILPCHLGDDARLLRVLEPVRDSKLLTAGRRRELLSVICAVASATAVGVVEPDELDAVGVGPANRMAMERAVLGLPLPADALVLDAATIECDLPQVGLIDGDRRSLSVAAASIVAKVTRDRVLDECHGADPRFGFCAHKGYATADHLGAVRRHGPCPWHRRSFRPVGHAIAAAVPDR